MPDYQQIYAAKFSHQHNTPAQQLDAESAATLYHAGLDAAAGKAMASISPQNRQRRSQVRDELSQHLAALPYGLGLANCSPEDLLVFMEMIYLPRHAGSILPDGTCIVAPSTISNVLSHLRMTFKELGRGDQWDDHSRSGNPAASNQVHAWARGHDKTSISSGFKTTSAVAMTESKIRQLLVHCMQQLTASSSSAYDRALAARDGAAFSLMWQTGMRSVNARTMKIGDFMLPGQAKGSLHAYLHTPSSTSHPGIIQVHPEQTKTHSQNPYSISIPPATEPVMDTFYWLAATVVTAHALGQPITSYVIRSSASSITNHQQSSMRFADQPLSRSGLYSRLVSQLQHINAYDGESLHSFRRGMAQFKAASGQSPDEIMAQMLLQTKHILEAVYLPAHRHQSGVKRLRSAAGQARLAML